MSQPAVLPTTTRTYHDYPRLLTRAVQVLVTYLGLLLVGFIFMVPLLWMLTTALKPLPDIFKIPPVWLPNPPQWQQLWEPWIQRDFTLYFGNTLQIALLSVVGEVLVSSLVAYAFARLRWPGRDLFFVLTLSAMMLPMQVRLIPLFLIFKQLGWINTHLPLIVPHSLAVPSRSFCCAKISVACPVIWMTRPKSMVPVTFGFTGISCYRWSNRPGRGGYLHLYEPVERVFDALDLSERAQKVCVGHRSSRDAR
ncbi:MAG: carbohydrate ABC transporter permease [Caldilineaceae bacterium]